MRGLFIHFLGLYFFALPSLSALSLEDYKIDSSYGRYSQCDQSLAKLNLFDDNGVSALCGPVSICNVLEKFRSYLSMKREVKHPQEVKTLTEKILPEIDIRNLGLNPSSLAKLAEKYFFKLNIRSMVKVWEQPGIEVFNKALDVDKAVIIEFDWWPLRSFSETDPWSEPYEEGHFVTVVGVHYERPGRFLVVDSWKPDRLFEIELIEKRDHSGQVYYLVQWPGEKSPVQPENRQSVLRGAVEIQVFKD